jgi:hypothetical protein
MQLELDDADVETLASALHNHLGQLNVELSRTDKYTMQHELARFVRRLEAITARVDRLRSAALRA